jgi:cyclic-di-GMP phosphodiesterase TipF (flagellum assembly factor)
MLRLTAIFIAVCMVLIAASVGAVLYLKFGLSVAEASIVAIAVLTALALYNTVSGRLRDRSDVSDQIADLSRASGDLARQAAEFGRRLGAIESKATAAVDKAHAISEPLAAEIGELGGLVKQLAQSVAAHEEMLAGRTLLADSEPEPAALVSAEAAEAAETAETTRTTETTQTVETSDRTEIGEANAAPAAITSGRFKGMELGTIVAIIQDAINANRVDLFLQPIVTLPQRKVRYYEAMSRLKGEDGDVIPAAEFLEFAEGGGLMPKLDNLLVFRCVQVVRRLLLKNRDIGLFCNVSAATLGGSEFPQLLDFLEANRALASSLIFEFTQSAFRAMGPLEHESLAALAKRGFRFSLDNLTDLRIEPRGLAEHGFRFIKVPATLLLSHANVVASDIHPADLSDLLGRFGIDLIAEKIEGEGAVVDLLDYDVRFGQGFLFSPPRPVRAEALQGGGDRGDVVAREAPSPGTAMGDLVTDTNVKPATGGERQGGLAQLLRGAAGGA